MGERNGSVSDHPRANAPPLPAYSSRKKWWKWPLIIVVLALLIFLFRGAILHGIASLLVVEEPIQTADYVLIISGDRSEERAAELYHEGIVSHVVIFEFVPGRLQRMKILETHATHLENQLLKRQIPQSAIVVVPAQAKSTWDVTRSLDDWLSTRPTGTRVLVCCDRLSSRRLASIFDQVLSVEHRENTRIYPLTHRYFDETNWWQRKEGVIAVFHGAFRLGYVGLIGEDKTSWREWEPDAYEAHLKRAGEAEEILP